MTPLSVTGMSGIGDAVHQRAVIKEFINQGYGPIYLKTSQPEIYWDYRERGLVKCVPGKPNLRTQIKNEARGGFDADALPDLKNTRTIWYTVGRIRRLGSYVKAMGEYAQAEDAHDFSLQCHPHWIEKANKVRAEIETDKPLLIFRPNCVRKEWDAPARNPDPAVVAALLESLRSKFYVLSVADLVDGVEWIDGQESLPAPDRAYHHGELHFTTIAGLMAQPGSVTMTPPGFAVCLGRAIGAPTIGVYGGHELSSWLDFGTPHPDRWLAINPTNPHDCMFRRCTECDKSVDIPAAVERAVQFCERFI